MWPQQPLHDGLIGGSADEYIHQLQRHHHGSIANGGPQGQQLPSDQHNGSTGKSPQGPRSDSLSYYEIRSQNAISSQRQNRNIAEKKRREDLNILMEDMKSRVPPIACSSQKTDKNSSLRKIAVYLRANRAYGGTYGFLSKNYGDFDIESYMIDYVFGRGGFGIALTSTGKIMHISSQVKEYLGYSPDDLINMSFYEFIHHDDHEELRRNINFDDSSQGARITELRNDNSNSSDDSASLSSGSGSYRKQRRTFKVRMAEYAGSKQENVQYEIIVITGVLDCKNPKLNPREIVAANNYVVFHGLAYLPKKRPITELSMMDANENVYITRHLLDSRILYCDPRVSIVTGYLLEEVSGRSAFSFMHKDDFRWTMMGLKQMYDQDEPCGTSCYRLKSKTGEYIYLNTHGYLEYDKDTQTVVSFVCINTRVSEEEGVRLIEQMKERFSAKLSEASRAMIQNGDNNSSALEPESQQSGSKSGTEVQARVEYAITCLFQDLKSPKQEISTENIKQERLSLSPQVNMLSWNANDSNPPSTPQHPGQSHLNGSPTMQPTSPSIDALVKVENATSVYKPPCDTSPQQYNLKRINNDDEIQETNSRKRRKENGNLNSDSDIKVVLQQMMMVNTQAVGDQLRRTHIEVSNSQQNRDTELYQLARDCENSALTAQRGIVTDCMVEQSNQKETLKQLQQAYQNWQVNMNIGV